MENAEGARVELTLTGITENYMFTRLYLPRAQLESLLGTAEIPWNTVYGQLLFALAKVDADQEVYRYIFREIELLALIGSGVGLALGVPLHKFIILTVEMDQLMFIRTIALRSYLLAVALTMVFTVVVCFVMRRHVRRISMVESMKAPE